MSSQHADKTAAPADDADRSRRPAVDGSAGFGRAVALYSAERLGLFVLLAGIGFLAGVRNLLLLLVAALVVSGVLSYVLLTRQRVAFGRAVERRWQQRRDRRGPRVRWRDRTPRPLAERRAREDAYAEAFQAEQDARST